MENIVVIDGEVRLRNVIDGESVLRNVIDGNAYPVLRSSSGTRDYEKLINKPRIEQVELIGNKDFEDLGLVEIDGDDLIRILVD